VSRSAGHLDLFAVGDDDRVFTAAWETAFSGWRGWWAVPGIVGAPGAPIAAVAKEPDDIDLFVTGPSGRVYSAAWPYPDDNGWRGWELRPSGAPSQFTRGAHVSAIARSTGKLDLFAVAPDGRIWTSAWESEWRGWWALGR
jgi:hypothetical protein